MAKNGQEDEVDTLGVYLYTQIHLPPLLDLLFIKKRAYFDEGYSPFILDI
jgi:hypothetical protein